MNLVSISIQRPVFAWILMFALIVFGAICLNRLGISQMPDVDFPVLTVSVTYEGASPEVVEAELIDPIEQKLLAIEGIQQMKSSARQGSGSVTLDFDINRNVDVALQEVMSALSQIRLPLGVDPPTIQKRNPEESPILFLGISSKKSLRDTLVWADEYLLDQLRFLPGIGEVSIGGFSQRNLRIWPDLEKLRQHDLTVMDLLDAIQTQHLETAAGQFSTGKQELRVRWLGETATPDEMSHVRILRRGGKTIEDQIFSIGDVARVEDDLSDIRRVARSQGQEAVAISIRKQRGSNEVELARQVRSKLENLQTTIPPEYKLQMIADFTKPTEAVVDTTKHKLAMAAVVTIIICFLFLGNWQSALNILFSIPTSIIGTLTILYFSNFTLNLFSLLALTLAISIVVDDAIMILENIVRHFRMGKSAAQASYDGSMEVLPAATAATLAVVAVFLPVIFMEGIIGKFFFQFGVTMSAAVLLSLLESVTITPMRSAALLSGGEKISRLEKKLDQRFEVVSDFYIKKLKPFLKHPKWVVLGSLIIFSLSLLLIRGVKQEFVPVQDQDMIQLTLQAKTGSSLEKTLQLAIEAEKVLNHHPDILSYFSSIGAGGLNTEVNQISIPITLKSREERKKTHLQVMDDLRKNLKNMDSSQEVKISMRDVSARSLTTGRLYPISMNLSGPDLKVLYEKSEELMKALENEGWARDLDTDSKKGLPELLIKPDRQAMATRGVSVESVAQTLNTTVAGVRVGQFTSGGRRYDVRIKIPDVEVRSEKNIEGIDVRNQYGLRVPLSELVTFQRQETYQAINRVNRQRAIGIFGNLAAGRAQGEVLKKAKDLAQSILPDGYSVSFEGTSAGFSEVFKGLTMALLMGVLVAYMILAIQFNSFVYPISVLAALPFSLTGALLVLWISHLTLNLFSFIGLVVLMGIAKKNSILIVEFTNQLRHRDQMQVTDALIHACKVRLRPILMTSAATVFAALPLVFGNSMGQETRTPMGMTILGGSLLSTLFTLFVVPCLYQLLSVFEFKAGALRK